MKAFRTTPSKKLVLNKYSLLQLFYNETQEKPLHSIRNWTVLPNAQGGSCKAETPSPSRDAFSPQCWWRLSTTRGAFRTLGGRLTWRFAKVLSRFWFSLLGIHAIHPKSETHLGANRDAPWRTVGLCPYEPIVSGKSSETALNTPNLSRTAAQQHDALQSAGCLPWWSPALAISWLAGSCSSLPLPSMVRVSHCMSPAWERAKFKIPNIFSIEYMLLLHHYKAEK